MILRIGLWLNGERGKNRARFFFANTENKKVMRMPKRIDAFPQTHACVCKNA